MPESPTQTEPTKKPGNTVYNPPYSHQKASAFDKKAIALLQTEPTMTTYEIGKQLARSGACESERYILYRPPSFPGPAPLK